MTLMERTRAWLGTLSRKVLNDDITTARLAAATLYVKGVHGHDPFLRSLKAQVDEGRALTVPQARGALNFWRRSILASRPKCRECFQVLTDQESIDRGVGPVCWERLQRQHVEGRRAAEVVFVHAARWKMGPRRAA